MTNSAEKRWYPNADWWADSGAVASLDFGLAGTFEDFEGAFRLIHDQYVWRRYMTPAPSGLRMNLHNLLPSTKVVVAKAGARDEAFGAELGRLRDRGRRVTEAAALAIDPDYRACGVAILVRLLRLATLHAARIARADDLCFLLHPRHRGFYQNLFPFRWFKERRAYPRVRGPRAVGVRLDLALIRALLTTEREGLTAGPCTNFLCGPDAYRDVMARLRRDLPRSGLTPPEWARLFAGVEQPAPEPSTFDLTAVGAVHSDPGGR